MPAKRTVILTSGHSGSTWLAMICHHPESGSAAFHEPLRNMLGHEPKGVLRALSSRPSPSRARAELYLAPYERWVGERTKQYAALVEIHAGAWEHWKGMRELLPQRLFLHVRNGIQVVHSHYYGIRNDPMSRARFRDSFEPLPESEYGLDDLDESESDFAKVCFSWKEQERIPVELGRARLIRLEDLTTSATQLREFVEETTGLTLANDKCVELQAVVVNRKVEGDRSPENLFWNVWNEPQRSLFTRICSQTMADFGYELPIIEAAPKSFDSTPTSPRARPFSSLGPLAPTWIFTSNPVHFPVIVYGRDKWALLAAEILGRDRTYLLNEDEQSVAFCPAGFERVSLSEARALEPRGVFLASAQPPEEILTRLAGLFPTAELVWMLPGEMTPALEHRMASIEQEAAAPEDVMGMNHGMAAMKSSDIEAVGPLRVGEQLDSRWAIVGLTAQRKGLFVKIRSHEGQEVVLLVSPVVGEYTPLFRVGDGGIYYRDSDVEVGAFAGACERLSDRIVSAAAGENVSEAMSSWTEVRAS